MTRYRHKHTGAVRDSATELGYPWELDKGPEAQPAEAKGGTGKAGERKPTKGSTKA
jgi:hypothetical protein